MEVGGEREITSIPIATIRTEVPLLTSLPPQVTARPNHRLSTQKPWLKCYFTSRTETVDLLGTGTQKPFCFCLMSSDAKSILGRNAKTVETRSFKPQRQTRQLASSQRPTGDGKDRENSGP